MHARSVHFRSWPHRFGHRHGTRGWNTDGRISPGDVVEGVQTFDRRCIDGGRVEDVVDMIVLRQQAGRAARTGDVVVHGGVGGDGHRSWRHRKACSGVIHGGVAEARQLQLQSKKVHFHCTTAKDFHLRTIIEKRQHSV